MGGRSDGRKETKRERSCLSTCPPRFSRTEISVHDSSAGFYESRLYGARSIPEEEKSLLRISVHPQRQRGYRERRDAAAATQRDGRTNERMIYLAGRGGFDFGQPRADCHFHPYLSLKTLNKFHTQNCLRYLFLMPIRTTFHSMGTPSLWFRWGLGSLMRCL
jgi:hypothetical protein